MSEDVVSRPCFYCMEREAVVQDHVVPRSLGGKSEPGNLVWSCMRCNASKGGHWLPPNWRFYIPEALEVGTSHDVLTAEPPSRIRFLLAVAARALVEMERARRGAVRAMSVSSLTTAELPNIRHGRR